MSMFFLFFAFGSYLSLVACSDDDEQARLLEGIVRRSALNDSLKNEIIQSEIGKASLEAISDSLRKSGNILLENNNQLSKELEKTKQEADKYRRNNEHLQVKVDQLSKDIVQLQEDKRIKEQEIRRMAVEIDSISVYRDSLMDVNQDLKNRLNEIKEILNDVHRIQKSVRLLVGTERLLKSNGFLETSRPRLLKQYKLVKKIENDNSQVKIVSLNQQVDLTPDSFPGALVGRLGKLKLKVLADRHGKLKEGRDYKIYKSKGTTTITFINRVLEGTDVLAVVEFNN